MSATVIHLRVFTCCVQCLTADDLFVIYDVNSAVGLRTNKFSQLCPALIQQQLDETCSEQDDTGDGTTLQQPTLAER